MKYLNIKDMKTTSSREFSRYGKKYDLNFDDIVSYMQNNTDIPNEGNIYIASDEKMENLDSHIKIKKEIYGNQPIQIGYCNGKNNRLNALEYHKGSELNIAITDFVLLLGDIRDIDGQNYDIKNVEAFYIKKGETFEIYSTTLHFSPCRVSEEGFKCVVILPKFTNTDLDYETNSLLYKNNKWILCHEEFEKLVNDGVRGRLIGENIEVI